MSICPPTDRPPAAAVARGCGILLALTGALALIPRPSDAWRHLGEPGAVTDPTRPLLAVVALAVWALTGWLALGVTLVCASHLPGLAGRAASAVAARAVPVVLRRAVEVALGAGLALGTVGVLPAGAETPAGGATGPVSLDWPTTSSPATGSAPTTSAGTSSATRAISSRPAVVVAPGDTLWHLAERSLKAAGEPSPSAAAIAATWPSWWATNREAVGADPDLIRPGTLLQAPPSS